jgi:hypothetical protein
MHLMRWHNQVARDAKDEEDRQEQARCVTEGTE